jgi:hypothetical protein
MHALTPCSVISLLLVSLIMSHAVSLYAAAFLFATALLITLSLLISSLGLKFVILSMGNRHAPAREIHQHSQRISGKHIAILHMAYSKK